MGLVSHRVERTEIEAGDHIYTWRTGFTYSHHGIFVGKKKVVHFTHGQDKDSSSGFFVSSCSHHEASSHHASVSCLDKLPTCPNVPDCGFQQPGSGVFLSCLDCFLGGGSLCRFEYGISPAAFLVKLRGGTCTTANSDEPNVVIRRAMYLLQNGFGNYDVFENNCEDFALYCKTGLLIHDPVAPGRSGQVSGTLGAPLAAILSSPLKFFLSSPIVMSIAGASLYCLSRYATDIGVRSDVIKVEAEDIVSFHGSERPKQPAEAIKCHKRSLPVEQTDKSLLHDQAHTPTSKRLRCC